MMSPRSSETALKALCDRGAALYRAGQSDEATNCYKKVLQRSPKHFGALYALGIINIEAGQSALGAVLLKRAIGVEPDRAEAHSNLGKALDDAHRPEEAIASFDRAIALRPAFAGAHYNRGTVLRALGRYDEAVTSFDRAIAAQAVYPEAYFNRGLSLQALKRFDEAVASFTAALGQRPGYARALNGRALAYQALDQTQAALADYDQAIAVQPAYAEAHNNRGLILHQLNQTDEALASCDRAIALNPRLAEAHYSRGSILSERKAYEQALASFDEAIAFKPDYVEAHHSRCDVLSRLWRPQEALASCDRAIRLRADFAPAHFNRGAVLRELGRYEEALASFMRAIELDAETADAKLERALTLLAMGRFEEGWPAHEDRLLGRRKPPPVSDEARKWRGEASIDGKRIFVHHEQGLGDTIQFCRFVSLLEARGADVVLSVQAPLTALLGDLTPTVEVINHDAVPDRFDFHCELLSLPLAFRVSLESIPASPRYLHTAPDRRRRMEGLLGPKRKRRIGVAWSGNPKHKGDDNRSIPFAQFADRLSDEFEWIAMQNVIRPWDQAAFDASGRVGFHGPELTDFRDNAALVDLMDLVISVDTSMAHLAGALGKPVWILLGFAPDWRWMLDVGRIAPGTRARAFSGRRARVTGPVCWSRLTSPSKTNRS